MSKQDALNCIIYAWWGMLCVHKCIIVCGVCCIHLSHRLPHWPGNSQIELGWQARALCRSAGLHHPLEYPVLRQKVWRYAIGLIMGRKDGYGLQDSVVVCSLCTDLVERDLILKKEGAPRPCLGPHRNQSCGVLLLLLMPFGFCIFLQSPWDFGVYLFSQRRSYCFQPFHKRDSDDPSCHVVESSLPFLEHLHDVTPSIWGTQKSIYSECQKCTCG